MKFICEGVVLSDAAMTVSKACATKTLTPVLECIKIVAQNDVITLTAYDGEISIEKKIRAEVIEEGSVCVNGKFFADFMGKVSDMTITLSSTDKGMEINYDDSKMNIQTLPGEDFPVIKKDNVEKSISLKQADFKKLISKTVFCCATDDSRPILKGCLIEAENGVVTATALDGFRMAVASTEAKVEGKEKIVCPARTLNEISKMMGDGDEEITVNFSKNAMLVSVEDTVIVSRLYVGEFVNKNNIFPPTFATDVFIKKAELVESIERASVVIRGDKNNLIVMDIKPGYITISANSEIGGATEVVKCDLQGKEIRIAMNAKYLLDALKAVEEETVKLSFNSSIAPFTVENKSQNNVSYLILPVRTNA